MTKVKISGTVEGAVINLDSLKKFEDKQLVFMEILLGTGPETEWIDVKDIKTACPNIKVEEILDSFLEKKFIERK